MPIDIQLDDRSLTGFSEPAKERLKTAALDYTSDVIEEANRIEAGRSRTKGPPEVTNGMVNDAVVLLRQGLGTPRKHLGIRLLRVVAAVLSLLVGIMYDASSLQDKTYMIIFVLLVAAAIFAVTVSAIKD